LSGKYSKELLTTVCSSHLEHCVRFAVLLTEQATNQAYYMVQMVTMD